MNKLSKEEIQQMVIERNLPNEGLHVLTFVRNDMLQYVAINWDSYTEEWLQLWNTLGFNLPIESRINIALIEAFTIQAKRRGYVARPEDTHMTIDGYFDLKEIADYIYQKIKDE